MKIALDTKGTLAGFKEAIDTVMRNDKAHGLLVLSFADNNFTPRELDVMHITEASMVQSAASAVNAAFDALKSGTRPQMLISFDCVSRKLFLYNRFGKELEVLGSTGVCYAGALTCGEEIGTSGLDFLDYHNRTCVVGVFEE